MKYNKISRRFMLQGMGGALVTLPFLPSLTVSRAFGAVGAGGQNFDPIFFEMHTANGMNSVEEYVMPLHHADDGYGDVRYDKDDRNSASHPFQALVTKQTMDNGSKGYHVGNLNDMKVVNGGVSQVFDSQFNGYLAKMNILRGISEENDQDHTNSKWVLGAYHDNRAQQTIDQIMAASSAFYRSAPILRSLNVVGNHHASSASFAQDNSNLPHQIFDQYLRNAVLPGGGGGGGGGQSGFRGKRAMDAVLEDYKKLRNSARLGSEDRQTLEAYITHIDELEKKLIAMAPVVTPAPAPGGGASVTRPKQLSSLPEVNNGPGASFNNRPSVDGASWNGSIRDFFTLYYQSMIDVAVALAATGQSRIFTLPISRMCSKTDSSYGSMVGGGKHYHEDCSHIYGRGSVQNLRPDLIVASGVWKWMMQDIFLHAIKKLDGLSNGRGGTLLDDAIVFFGNELALSHHTYDVKLFTAGGAGGNFTTGKYYDFNDRANPNGIMDTGTKFRSQIQRTANGTLWAVYKNGVGYRRFLITMMTALGIPSNEFLGNGSGGALRFANYRLGSMTFNYQNLDSPIAPLLASR